MAIHCKAAPLAAAAILAAGLTTSASALTAHIAEYDILNADISGSGGWTHIFTGSITPTTGSLADYIAGNGTLNDGQLGVATNNNQLFITPTADVEMTFYFDKAFAFSRIDIFGGTFAEENDIPGNISGFDVTIGSTTVTVATTGYGPLSSDGQPANDYVDLAAYGLAGILADRITLSNFTVFDASGFDRRFNIAEIEFSSAVPLPAALPLFASGIGALGALGWRRRRRAARQPATA